METGVSLSLVSVREPDTTISFKLSDWVCAQTKAWINPNKQVKQMRTHPGIE